MILLNKGNQVGRERETEIELKKKANLGRVCKYFGRSENSNYFGRFQVNHEKAVENDHLLIIFARSNL